jgi:DNA polymerase-3 subunit epsilon
MRQVVLDTETTGLEPAANHRIIEIGAVELLDRKPTGRQFHKYVNPEREIDAGAFDVHGISREFLADKPLFADVADELVEFLRGAELVIHNAPFDVAFLDYEFSRMGAAETNVHSLCRVTDSLALARHKHPGQKNSLDALCRRYEVDNTARTQHGALLDAEILADVYLAMTGGQTALFAADSPTLVEPGRESDLVTLVGADRPALRIVLASAAESAAHDAWLDTLDQRCDSGSLWRRIPGDASAESTLKAGK